MLIIWLNIQNITGWLLCPDKSPENAPAAHQGSSLDAGVTMTNQIVFDVFTTAIDAAKILNKDKAFADTLKANAQPSCTDAYWSVWSIAGMVR